MRVQTCSCACACVCVRVCVCVCVCVCVHVCQHKLYDSNLYTSTAIIGRYTVPTCFSGAPHCPHLWTAWPTISCSRCPAVLERRQPPTSEVSAVRSIHSHSPGLACPHSANQRSVRQGGHSRWGCWPKGNTINTVLFEIITRISQCTHSDVTIKVRKVPLC